MSEIQTPNGYEFSIAAKVYLCSDLLLPEAGIMFGYPSPAGKRIDVRTLAKGVLGCTLDWLERNNYVQLWQEERKVGLGKAQLVMVRAVYSGAPGFAGKLLEATRWQDCDFMTMCMRMLPLAQAPFIDFCDAVAYEFEEAGILTRGGYAAHGNVWNSDWFAYLHDAFYPEAYDAWMRTHARPDWKVIERNVMLAVAQRQHTEDDDHDDAFFTLDF
ncbi:MAG: hypothetical protein QMD76_05200 [Anaerosomatales bacterium]|nr:hypothetical protein [Anaerosomatales bacterium]